MTASLCAGAVGEVATHGVFLWFEGVKTDSLLAARLARRVEPGVTGSAAAMCDRTAAASRQDGAWMARVEVLPLRAAVAVSEASAECVRQDSKHIEQCSGIFAMFLLSLAQRVQARATRWS